LRVRHWVLRGHARRTGILYPFRMLAGHFRLPKWLEVYGFVSLRATGPIDLHAVVTSLEAL